ncbi:MAG: hypothetical protein RDU20_19825 [Desulfomonilaceae bacterium]|nr:hypothetical protein [Desulfomonilaceae bacterium]
MNPSEIHLYSLPDSFSVERVRSALGLPEIRSQKFVECLPFAAEDVTAGSETELQTAVSGDRCCVDLPVTIENSNYFANIVRRASAGDSSRRAVTDLEKHVHGNTTNIWDNSWVRFPLKSITPFAQKVLARDLRSDRSNGSSSPRKDRHKFLHLIEKDQWLRIPMSYLVKLALADVLGSQDNLPELVHAAGCRVMDKFLSDNTSPETLSFHVVSLRKESRFGRAIAKETSKRFLLTQLIVMYANSALGLVDSGQRAMMYSSPHPPVRQKMLNDCISDSFYRELFMNPCLSGWDNGVEKHAYMCLCHQVLGRSQLNAVAKLREAGIITRNLVILPNVSNISLANNGTHLSLGSRTLSRHLQNRDRDFSPTDEKCLGDLVIKIVEHFLPLFVGTYSAAPYRLDFGDFHPEKVLGFLPHELDYTHLRMLWRRWKKKASIRILGRSTTPFGLKSIDRALTTLFRCKGDFMPDFRLIDYMTAPMSTDRSPALDGKPGNTERLKRDLADLGVFDTRMALYMPYRLREYHRAGYSGFEGRHYSLFESLDGDMSRAANLQVLVTALAFKYSLQGSVRHSDIPDEPFIESERRQVFFGSAIGIPTFYVHGSTGNLFLKRILLKTNGIRRSRRYPGYLRVYRRQYLLALVEIIRTEGADLVENLGMEETVRDLCDRIDRPRIHSAEGKLTAGILDIMGVDSPMKARAQEFNFAAEHYYRNDLKTRHIREGLDFLREDLQALEAVRGFSELGYKGAFRYVLGERSATGFLDSMVPDIIDETVHVDDLRRLIDLMLATVHHDCAQSGEPVAGGCGTNANTTPVH